MAQTVLITLTTAGTDTGPFNLYSNLDGFTVPFESAVPKLDLEAGYTSYLVPDSALIIRVQSDNPLCSNYVDLVIGIITTTTSTSSTSTTTTTMNPDDFDFYLAYQFSCVGCSFIASNILVAFPAGTSVTSINYYRSASSFDYVYRIDSIASPGAALLLTTTDTDTDCGVICNE